MALPPPVASWQAALLSPKKAHRPAHMAANSPTHATSLASPTRPKAALASMASPAAAAVFPPVPPRTPVSRRFDDAMGQFGRIWLPYLVRGCEVRALAALSPLGATPPSTRLAAIHQLAWPHEATGELVLTVGGPQPGASVHQFHGPRGITLTPNGSKLLVCDAFNQRIVVLDAGTGACSHVLTGPAGTLQRPSAVAIVPSTGHVWVTDVLAHRVVCFRSVRDDTVLGSFGPGMFFLWL